MEMLTPPLIANSKMRMEMTPIIAREIPSDLHEPDVEQVGCD